MRKFLDAIADSYFEPHDDGTVRFALARPEHAYVTLSEAEAQGMRPLWRSLVRCHVYAAHLFVLIGIFAPWTGVLLLLIMWFVGIFLVLDLRSQWGPKAAEEWDHFRKVHSRLCQYLSRRRAVWLGVASLLAIVPGTAIAAFFLRSFLPLSEGSFVCFWIVALRWALFFFGVALWSIPSSEPARMPDR